MDKKQLLSLIARLEQKAQKQKDKAYTASQSEYSHIVRIRKDSFKKIFDSDLFVSAEAYGDGVGKIALNDILKTFFENIYDSASYYYNTKTKRFYWIDCFYNSVEFTY